VLRAATAGSYSITMRLHTPPDHGIVGAVATAIAEAGGVVTGIDVVESGTTRLRLDVTCSAAYGDHALVLQEAIGALAGVEVHKVSDRTFLLHLGGKIEVHTSSIWTLPRWTAATPSSSVTRGSTATPTTCRGTTTTTSETRNDESPGQQTWAFVSLCGCRDSNPEPSDP
jgi:hypothetical protein